MKQVLVLSGKGGTGKTTIAAALIHLLQARAYADCDVDAPNLHLLMHPEDTGDQTDFYGLDRAVIDPEMCSQCGLCQQHCRFGAIRWDGEYGVDPFACEGCGVCAFVCPPGAVTMKPAKAGELKLYYKPALFSTARLKMGSGHSGLLVTEVKKRIQREAERASLAIPMAVIDGSPGIGCPVIASIAGTDLVLVVAEPSLSGINDMKRIMQTAVGLNARLTVCVNQWDNSPEHAEEIRQYCEENEIPFLGRIPYDPMVVEMVNQERSMAEVPCKAGEAVAGVYERLLKILAD